MYSTDTANKQLLDKINRLEATIVELRKSEKVHAFKQGFNKNKTSEEEFRLSEEWNLLASAASDNGIWDWWVEQNNIYYSDQWKAQLGYKPNELTNEFKTWEGLLHPDCKESMIQKVTDFLANPSEFFIAEFRMRHKDGSYRYIYNKAATVTGKDGKVIRMVGVHKDITEQKREEQIKKVLYNISNAVIISDNIEQLIGTIQKELGTVIDTTNFYIAFYEKASDTLSLPFFKDEKDEFSTFPAGKTLTYYVIKTKKSLLANKKRISELEMSGDVEAFGSDTEIWLGVPLKIEGNVTGVIAIQSYTDEKAYGKQDLDLLEFVSSQISTLLERKKAEQSLKESEERFKKLSELTFEGIVIHNNGIVEDVNLSGAKMFDYEYEEIIGENIIKLLVAPEYHDIVAERMSESHVSPYEAVGIKKDGTKFPIEIEVRDISSEIGGEIIRVAAVRDITNRKNAEKELRVALEKSTESDRLKSAFLTTISHEMRTPLNAIIGFSEIINEELTIHEILEFNRTINDSGMQLLSIVEDIFDITLIETGYIQIEKREEKLQSILKNIYEVIKIEQVRTHKLHLAVNQVIPPDCEDMIIYTDPAKFKQIVINLLKNALKFTYQGYINYGFSIATDQNNKQSFKFFVEDTGIGISKDNQKVIFDIFRQVEDEHTRMFGGTGIGLSISKKIIDLFGGNIWVESEEGKGSVFYFTIPLESLPIRDSNRETSIAKAKVISESKGKFNSKIVLVVDDDENSFEFIKLTLDILGIKSIWAKNGHQAINFCKKINSIDLVIMDIDTPKSYGYGATIEIKKIKAYLPILAQTVYPISEDKGKALDVGCDDYLFKNLNKTELLEIVSKYLRQYELADK